MLTADSTSIFNFYEYSVRPSTLMEKYYSDTLNSKFWKEGQFDADIRKKLLTIALDFYKGLDVGEAPIIDVQLTGSLANYNYTDYSDLDVHIIIDFSKINNDTELVKQALDGARFVWNNRHNIEIRGHDVELYMQDVNEQHTASGLYSILRDEWIRKPVHNPPEIDERDVAKKYQSYVSEIEQMEKQLESKSISIDNIKKIANRAAHLKQKIQRGRKDCLQYGNEFCVENLVFKTLRGTGMIEKLINLSTGAYDKIFSEK